MTARHWSRARAVAAVVVLLTALLTPTTVVASVVMGPGDGGSGCSVRTPPAPGTTVRTTVVGGIERSYRLHIPRGYTGRRPYPLILAYHGHAEKAADLQRYSGLSRLPAVVVFADGLPGTDGMSSWQGAPYSSPASDDIAFTQTILREVRAIACTDRGRTYAVGRSNGGGLVAMLTCRLPGEFAAFAIVNGALYNQSWRGCDSAPPVSVIEFHGTADPVIHYGGGVQHGGHYVAIPAAMSRWATRGRCAPTPVITQIERDVSRFDWICGAPGAQVTHYRIAGGSHVWPGGTDGRTHARPSDTLPATAIIWKFFNTHRLHRLSGMP